MSEPEFDKDIELAKLQAKIADSQTEEYTAAGGILAGFIALAVLIYSAKLQTLDVIGVFGTMGLLYVVLWGTRKQLEHNRGQFRKDFERIYRRERIEY